MRPDGVARFILWADGGHAGSASGLTWAGMPRS